MSVFLRVLGVLLLGALFLCVVMALSAWAGVAHAEQVCQSVYNPHSGEWTLECVERASQVSGPPVACRQVYDAMNNRWVTVCE